MSTHRPRNRPSFLVRGAILFACLVLGAATSAFAQQVTIGFKTGTPLTDVMRTTAFSSLGGVPFQAETKSYTIGPVLNISFPGPLGIEVGTMYKRINQKAAQVTITGFKPPSCADCEDGSAILKIQSITTPARSWEFPVAVQYHFPLRSIGPYVEGGFSYNHLSDVLENPYPYGLPFPGPSLSFVPTVSSVNRMGFLFGGGVEIKTPIVRLTPGLRYTRYDKVQYFLPSPNAVDFLVGFQLKKF